MKLGILGSSGRMGRMIMQELRIGAHAGVIEPVALARGDDLDAAFKTCDVMIDFTAPQATAAHASLAAQYAKPLIVGTTGIDLAGQKILRDIAGKAPVFHAVNMSLGVNLLLSLVEQAAERLGPGFDIEIFEAHHRNKKDAPSGTALALGAAAAKGRGVAFDDVMRLDRAGKRRDGDIGFSVFRGGDVVGDHVVTFAGIGERVELTHKATDRAVFAKGAIKAALWIKDKPPGFYTMRDVLGI